MTAAVAGTAARAAGGRAAASGAARSAGRAPTRSGRAPRPNIDEREANAARRTQERGDRAAGNFRARYNNGTNAGEKKTPKTPEKEGSAVSTGQAPSVNVSLPGSVSSGAGFILAFIAWTWIGLPFLKGGPEAVKTMLRAKFTNKRSDGSYLP